MTKAVAFQPLDTFQINKMTESSEHSFNKVTSYGQLFAFDDLQEGDSHPEDNVLDSTTKIRLEWLVSPKSSLEASLVKNCQYAAQFSNGCLNRMVDSLSRLNYAAKITASKAVSSQQQSFYNLPNKFITIRLGTEEFIVDPAFKDHFMVHDATPRFEKLLELVRDVVVLPRPRFQRAVTMLATELQRCFEAKQRALPPWRKLKSLLSKWEAGTTSAAAAAPAAVVVTRPAVAKSNSLPNMASPDSVLGGASPPIPVGNRVASPPRHVGFNIDTQRRECFCCSLMRKQLRDLMAKEYRGDPHSAPAA